MIYETDDEHVDINGRRDVTGIIALNARYLYCSNTGIKSIDNLPSGLRTLSCCHTGIKTLDNLPSGMKTLYCSNTGIKTIDHLPGGLEYLDCSNTDIAALDHLPSGLKTLCCNNTGITSLDNLPSGLRTLCCRYTSVKALDNLHLIDGCLVYGLLPWPVCLRDGKLRIGCEEHTPDEWQADLDVIAAKNNVTGDQLERVREFVDAVVNAALV